MTTPPTTPPPAAPAATVVTEPSCVHCGFCLPACPTWPVLGTEMDNPRGRLALMAALDQGRIAEPAHALRHLDLCLGCRACESACPSGVPYGAHLEATRSRWRHAVPRSSGQRWIERLVLAGVAAPRGVQALGWTLGRLAARTATALDLARRLPPRWRAACDLLATDAPSPRDAGTARDAAGPPCEGPARTDTPRMRVALLEGCVQRFTDTSVTAAAARLLRRAGCDVVVPPGQACCGALADHAGDREGARRLVRRNLAALAAAGPFDAVVSDAAGCGAHGKHWDALFTPDEPEHAAARAVAAHFRDALELLAELDAPAPERRRPRRVAYHDACHLVHAQGLRAPPRDLLAAIPGLELVPLEESDRCCGAAGLYSLLHPETADAVLARKLQHLAGCGAETVAAANPGCLAQLRRGVRSAGLALEVRHPLELLDDACD